MSAAQKRRRVVRVLAVDDQAVFRRVAHALVDATEGFGWAGEAASGVEALARAGETHPDLALVDVRMPGMDGLETARRLVEGDPALVVVLVSLDGGDDLPPAVATPAVAAHLRKQELSPRVLRELWERYGARAVSAAPASAGARGRGRSSRARGG